MIEGLKLTMTGSQLRVHLEDRIRWHEGRIRRGVRALKAPKRNGRERARPDDAVEGAIAASERRIELLALIHEYIVPGETYRLGEGDLRFADLVPEADARERVAPLSSVDEPSRDAPSASR